MTRRESTGVRDLTFSQWIRDHLPDSETGFLVSDLDFILWNYKTRRLMMIESKSYNSKMRKWQENLFGVFDQVFVLAAARINPPIDYRGFHCIRFENKCFADGRCWFDSTLVTEQELIKILSMECEH